MSGPTGLLSPPPRELRDPAETCARFYSTERGGTGRSRGRAPAGARALEGGRRREAGGRAHEEQGGEEVARQLCRGGEHAESTYIRTPGRISIAHGCRRRSEGTMTAEEEERRGARRCGGVCVRESG